MNRPALTTPPTSEEISSTFVEAVRIFTGDLAEAPTVAHVAALAAAADELAARISPMHAARLDQLMKGIVSDAVDDVYNRAESGGLGALIGSTKS